MWPRTATLSLVVILCAACGDSCGCGAPTSGSQAKGGFSLFPSSTPTREGAAGQAGGGPVDPLKVQLTPMPKSSERDAIETVVKDVNWDERLGAPVVAQKLATALPSRVNGLTAEGPAQAGESIADAGKVSFASRRYTKGRKVMNLKITDTAESPAMRKTLQEQLLAIGNTPSGDQHGDVIEGIPGVRAFHAEQHVSRAMALIAGRFLVEVLVDETDDADDAWNAVETLDLSKVLKSLPAAPRPTAPSP